MARELPKEVHLYWCGERQEFTFFNSKGLDGYSSYKWLAVHALDFGGVEFDEKALRLEALNKALGEAQGKVNALKEEIQKLLAIGHEESHWPLSNEDKDDVGNSALDEPAGNWDKFDDDIPF